MFGSLWCDGDGQTGGPIGGARRAWPRLCSTAAPPGERKGSDSGAGGRPAVLVGWLFAADSVQMKTPEKRSKGRFVRTYIFQASLR